MTLQLDPARRGGDAPAGRAGDDAAAGAPSPTRRSSSGSSTNIFRRLDLRRPRLGRRRARRLPDARDRRRQRLRRSAARTAGPRAFLNVCRHRGVAARRGGRGQVRKRHPLPLPRLVLRPRGQARAPLRTWTRSRTSTPPAAACVEVRSAVVGGLVLVDLSGEAPDRPRTTSASCCRALERYRVGELRRGGSLTYEVEANWKGIAENYNECLHCPGVHPELNALSDYMSGESVYGAGAWCGGSMTLDDGRRDDGHRATATPADRPPIAGLDRAGPAPVLLLRAVPERAGLAAPRLRDAAHPLAAGSRTGPTSSASGSSSRRRSRATDFDPSDAVGFWDKVNGEDWHVCELTQKGVGIARLHRPAATRPRKHDVHAFDAMVAARYMEALREEVPA